jgi:hypothetical protein
MFFLQMPILFYLCRTLTVLHHPPYRLRPNGLQLGYAKNLPRLVACLAMG